MTRICDSSSSNMSETKVLLLTVDELFFNILNRMDVAQEDISSFQGEYSDKITKTFEDKFEDIFDMDKFRFASEYNMTKKGTEDFLKYVDKRNTRLTKLNNIYHFGKCIINQSKEYMKEHRIENISELKSIFLEKFEELFSDQEYFVIKALLPEMWAFEYKLKDILSSSSWNEDILGCCCIFLCIFERIKIFEDKVDEVCNQLQKRIELSKTRNEKEYIRETPFYNITTYSNEISILRTLLMLCIPTLYPSYKPEHHKKMIFMMRIQIEFLGVILNGPILSGNGPQYLFLRHNYLISHIFFLDKETQYEVLEKFQLLYNPKCLIKNGNTIVTCNPSTSELSITNNSFKNYIYSDDLMVFKFNIIQQKLFKLTLEFILKNIEGINPVRIKRIKEVIADRYKFRYNQNHSEFSELHMVLTLLRERDLLSYYSNFYISHFQRNIKNIYKIIMRQLK